MSKLTNGPNRWRPKFSLRLLMLLVTLVCLYFAGWQLTVTRGAKSLAHYLRGERNRLGNSIPIEVKAPFVLAAQLSTISNRPTGLRVVRTKSLYLWAFGRFIKLPFTTEKVLNTPQPPARAQFPWIQVQPRFLPPPVAPPWERPSPSPADTPPYERVMPYRPQNARTWEVTVYT
jgi:hypothetical protein